MNKVRVAGHALHPMLIVFPLGLLATSLAWDLIYLGTRHASWAQLSFWTIIAGLIGGVCAAIPGFIDWIELPRHTRAFRIGAWHLVLNLLVIVLFVISAATRNAEGFEHPGIGAMVFGWIGIAVAIVSGWLGGELVERLGVGVFEGANLNAPSSLTGSSRGREPLPPFPTEPSPFSP